MRRSWVIIAASACMGAAEPEFDTAPEWLTRPDPRAFQLVWPAKAWLEGKGGLAVLSCRVTAEGRLRACAAVQESPAGYGFGDAALALAPQFLMKPATKDGQSVGGATVRIPVGFKWTGGKGDPDVFDRQVLSNVAWRSAPTLQEVAAAYPAEARAKNAAGIVGLSCMFAEGGRLRGCKAATEQPKGLGFADAALALAGGFVGPEIMPNGEGTEGHLTQFHIAFPAELIRNEVVQVSRPEWTQAPSAELLKAALPAELQTTAASGTMRVVLDCAVVADGVLSDCRVASEDPVGRGLGAAGLAIAKELRASLWTRAGYGAVGGRVRASLKFGSPGPQAATAAP